MDDSRVLLIRRIGVRGVVGIACLLSFACQSDPSARKREYLESGNRYLADGKYPHAIIEYRNAIDIDPTFGEARTRLAEAYARTGDAPQALEQYVRAADFIPTDVQLQLTAGAYLLAARKPGDALARADYALRQQPDSIQALLLRGNALAGLSSFDEALKAIEEAIRLDPERGTSFTQLGLVEFARGRTSEAEAAFIKAVELAPKSVETYFALGNFYWSVGNAAETEKAFQGALNVDAKNGMANRAMAAFSIATWVLIRHSTTGRQLYAFGDNPEGARRLGINIAAMHFIAFGWLGLMSGIAGLVQVHYAQEVVPNALVGRELDVLAAVVLGGARLGGGRGTVLGCILGVFLISVTQNGLNLLGISPYAFKMIVGATILMAITLSNAPLGQVLAGMRQRMAG